MNIKNAIVKWLFADVYSQISQLQIQVSEEKANLNAVNVKLSQICAIVSPASQEESEKEKLWHMHVETHVPPHKLPRPDIASPFAGTPELDPASDDASWRTTGDEPFQQGSAGRIASDLKELAQLDRILQQRGWASQIRSFRYGASEADVAAEARNLARLVIDRSDIVFSELIKLKATKDGISRLARPLNQVPDQEMVAHLKELVAITKAPKNAMAH